MPLSQLPNGLVAFGPNANCTLDACPLNSSILRYQPSIPASAVCIAIFGFALAVHAVEGIWKHTWGFMGSVIAGCILEILGYVGRLIIHDNPFNFQGFLMQIICITIAPVFFCSAIYVLLSQVINFIDPALSRIKPQLFYWIFIPCDIISLVLQALGGALSCTGSTQAAIQVGVDISLAGLVFQVFTLTIFCGLFVDYLNTCRRSPARRAFTKRMNFFLVFMFISIILILVRCCYRIVELHDGYFSSWFRDQSLFIALESGIMCAAILTMIFGHPGIGLPAGKGKSSKEEKPPSDF